MIKLDRKIIIRDKHLSASNRKILNGFKRSLLLNNRTQSTVYNYLKDVEFFMLYLDKSVIEVKETDVRAFLKECYELGNSYTRILRRYRVLTTFNKFMLKNRLCRRNFVKNVNISKYNK